MAALVFPMAGARGQVPAAGEPEFKIAFWFRKSDPVGSFRWRAYDLRKGEYTRAVDDWLALMARKHPGYIAYVRPIDLDREPGRTETETLKGAVGAELNVVATTFLTPAVSISGHGGMSGVPPGPGIAVGGSRLGRGSGPIGMPGGNAFGPYGGAPGGLFPVPVPYPRPHP